MNSPRAIGFWHYPYEDQEKLPHPCDLVQPGWISLADRSKLVTYLRQGAAYEKWRGFSHCRFCCGMPDTEMGDRDLTDGVWVWPQGLSHYIDKHDIMLPDEFLAHCRAQNWNIPPNALEMITRSHLNYDSWITWAEAVKVTIARTLQGS